MAIQSKFSSTSQLFDKSIRGQKFANFVSRERKDFKQSTKNKMIRGIHSGRVYSRKRGAGFIRGHRASARGQRPAPDTLTLVNAIAEKSTGNYSGEVFIADKVNPDSGTLASKYGPILQEKLDRPIMSEQDAAEAQIKMNTNAEAFIKTVI